MLACVANSTAKPHTFSIPSGFLAGLKFALPGSRAFPTWLNASVPWVTSDHIV